ncbi:hypothetical protein PIIN_03198 [Serendipita indica DSM 11827]|uniref:Uncharacterized protein n=1 Tax=Serendipita indica (strain DSM 11827) TaxID=1109443 RepID=G4TD84_SERID|nr:hypothetical protein PIIN_03198 [Serendipita indica DSM 11827]
MASITSSIENLFHSLWQIVSGLAGSFAAVGTSLIALVQHLFQAVFGILAAIITAITDLMSGLVGFVLGECVPRDLEGYSDTFSGNVFIILALGAAYWFWATQTTSGQRRTAGGRKNPLK